MDTLKTRLNITTTANVSTYNFSFDYLNEQYIKVILNGNALVYNTDYKVNDHTVLLLSPPQGGLPMVIYRETDRNPIVEWVDSSIMTAKGLNLQQKQLLHITEELQLEALTARLSAQDSKAYLDQAKAKVAELIALKTETEGNFNESLTEIKKVQQDVATKQKLTSDNKDAITVLVSNATNIQTDITSKKTSIEQTYATAQTLDTALKALNTQLQLDKTSIETTANQVAKDSTTSTTNLNTMVSLINEAHQINSDVTNSKTAVKLAETNTENAKEATEISMNTTLGYKTTIENLLAQTTTSQQDIARLSELVSNQATTVATNTVIVTTGATTATTQAELAKKYAGEAKAVAGGDFLTTTQAEAVYAKKGDYVTIQYIEGAIANIVKTAPEALNTLDELAKAINNDPNFSSTILTEIGKKANSSDVYIKSYIDEKINERPTRTEMTSTYATLQDAQTISTEINKVKQSIPESYVKTESDSRYYKKTDTVANAVNADLATQATMATRATTATTAENAPNYVLKSGDTMENSLLFKNSQNFDPIKIVTTNGGYTIRADSDALHFLPTSYSTGEWNTSNYPLSIHYSDHHVQTSTYFQAPHYRFSNGAQLFIE